MSKTQVAMGFAAALSWLGAMHALADARQPQQAAPADAWWTKMGLTAEDVGLAVRPWATNPPLADLERGAPTAPAARAQRDAGADAKAPAMAIPNPGAASPTSAQPRK